MRATALGVILVLALPAWAGEVDHAGRYSECMVLAREAPKEALDAAEDWLNVGGGVPAEHCVAVALMGLDQAAEAGRRLEGLAEKALVEPRVKAGLLAHAGQAWMLADDPERARAAFSMALLLDPHDPDLYVDLARALAGVGDYEAAEKELTKVLRRIPFHVDALVFRASARRYLDKLDMAAQDVERALNLSPTHLDGLLERGIVRRLTGNDKGARDDWMWILRMAPESPAADAARANLERMDVKKP